VTVPANETMTQRVYLTAPPAAGGPADRTEVRLWVEEGTTNRVTMIRSSTARRMN
jgi:hypothetical protein